MNRSVGIVTKKHGWPNRRNPEKIETESYIRYAQVILPRAITGTYTYAIADDMPIVLVGWRVVVPLGTKQVVGIVDSLSDTLTDGVAADKIRPIIALLDSFPVVTEAQLRLWHWISDYYLCPIGDVLLAAMPGKVLDTAYSFDPMRKRRVHLPVYSGPVEAAHRLTDQQQRAVSDIHSQWREKQTVLLQGVTSSGKTEVYIHLIEEQLQQGKQVLYLVPEIALTTQLTERLQRVFGNRLLVYHSRVTDTQRAETYRQVLAADETSVGQVIVGARSAVFLPFRRLGLVIVDEEHDFSYKQQDPAPRYHARSVAIMTAHQTDARVLLGTATPAIESQHNALTGKYGYVTMPERFQGLQLPKITLINLERQYHRKEMYGHFSDPLVARINEELQQHRQVILFQNRRGYAPYMQCPRCGYVPKCPECDVSLTVHRNHTGSGMECHYCGHQASLNYTCPECGGEMVIHGFGTERLEDEVARLFPTARMARLDLDTTRKKDAYDQIIRQFGNHEVDLLIGTQMVTKGLHFDDVSLVAVLNADNLFNLPSFRSYERAYQMLEQVAGRAGRKGKQGEVIIQTFDPNHPLFDYLKRHDTDGFYHWQVQEREQFRFPPFVRLCTLTIKHTDEQRVEQTARLLQGELVAVFGKRCSPVLRPGITRVQNQHIRQVQLRIENTASLSAMRSLVNSVLRDMTNHPQAKSCTILTDMDPI